MIEEVDDKAWRGSPLGVGEMDPYGIREVVIELENGDEDVFRPYMREEFGSYELHEMSVYIETLSRGLSRDPNTLS